LLEASWVGNFKTPGTTLPPSCYGRVHPSSCSPPREGQGEHGVEDAMCPDQQSSLSHGGLKESLGLDNGYEQRGEPAQGYDEAAARCAPSSTSATRRSRPLLALYAPQPPCTFHICCTCSWEATIHQCLRPSGPGVLLEGLAAAKWNAGEPYLASHPTRSSFGGGCRRGTHSPLLPPFPRPQWLYP
jgi:hypothetical protein